MAAEYYLLVKNSSGTKVAQITDYHYLTYRKVVNEPGILTFELDADHPAISTFQLDGQIEVWRRNTDYNIGWYADFYSLYRFSRYKFTDHDTFLAECPGQLHWLSRRSIAWFSGTSNRSTFNATPAETIMKTLVQYNATTDATVANGRLRAGAFATATITIAADTAAGNILSWSGAYKNLLSELQDIAEAGGGDFDLVKTGDTTWDFRWYTGQRGTDRTATVTFALQYGNMKEPTYERDRIGEKTVAVVAGQGEGSERATTVVTGPDFAAANDIEIFIDARDVKTTAALTSRGETKLQEYRSRNEFDFKVIQTAQTAYGLHYFLGDLVHAKYRDIEADVKVQTVTVSYQPQGEEIIDVDMMDPQSP